MSPKFLNRRTLIGLAACGIAPALRAATPFWNRKPPAEWSADEITQLLNRSPWSRETNFDFEAVEGGRIELPPGGAPGQQGNNNGPPSRDAQLTSDRQAGVMRRATVVVRWESAQPVRDALQLPPLQGFEGRYVISVSNIPAGAMNHRRRGEPEPTPEEVIAELQGAATLEVTGRDPAGAGIVRRLAGSQSSYLFGFSQDLLPLTGNEKEVVFLLHTARVSVKEKFELKNMIYHGKLAV
jgi:hypothetical protein